MHPRHGTWLIAGASLLGLALGASAQTRPSTFVAGPPTSQTQSTTAPAGSAPTRRPAYLSALTAASAPTRPSTVAAAPSAYTGPSRTPLAGPAQSSPFSFGNASAQTRPSTYAAAPPANPAPSRTPAAAPAQSQPFGFAAASAQTRPSAFVAAPPRGNPAQSQPLPIDRAAAGRVANSAVNTRGRTVNAKFISANAAAINSVQIPVLLPGDPDLAANLRIFPNGPFYTVSSKSAGMAFVLMGSGRAFPVAPGTAKGLPGGSLAGRIPADGIVIDGSEAGISASFNRFGASYSISLECASPLADPRCTSPAYIRGVIGRLMVIMPGTAS